METSKSTFLWRYTIQHIIINPQALKDFLKKGKLYLLHESLDKICRQGDYLPAVAENGQPVRQRSQRGWSANLERWAARWFRGLRALFTGSLATMAKGFSILGNPVWLTVGTEWATPFAKVTFPGWGLSLFLIIESEQANLTGLALLNVVIFF